MGGLHGALAAAKRQSHGTNHDRKPLFTRRTGAVASRPNADVFLPLSRSNITLPNSDRIETMRRNPRLFRLTASAALTALLFDTTLPLPAAGQPAPPPLPQPYTSQTAPSQTDPPARVGRILRISGTMSVHNAFETDWSAASVNYPVSTGNAFWTEPASTAELELSGSRAVLAPTTEFDITTLDGNGLQAVASRGEVYLNPRDLAPNETWSVQTPRSVVRLGIAGRYVIVVGSTEQPTLITVLEGVAEVEGPGVSMRVTGGQTATIDGTDTFQGTLGPVQHDPFLSSVLDSERPPLVRTQIPEQVAAMPGGSDLARYGDWAPAPEYGQVWYPPVASDWVPYRHGHWAYVAPWGWTWVDDAAWGFAPFHYGRWVEIGERWAWTPGGYDANPPIYAPALVTFFGIGAGIVVGAALANPSIGWVPLGPHEPFHPWYRVSDRYRREINVNHATNINNVITINNYVNRGAATAVAGSAMAASRPVQSAAQPLTRQQFATARPIVGQQPIHPTAATSGVTPAVARQFHLDRAAGSASGPAIRPPSPGPAVVGLPHPGAVAPDPGFHGIGGGSPPIRPSIRIEAPALPGPVVSPPGMPAPRVGGPPQPPPAVIRPEPAFVRPAAPPPHTESRPLPQVVTPSHPELQRFSPPPAMPHPEPQHFAPPPAMPHPEPQRFAPPPAMPHPEPQRFAPPAPRAEPPHAAAPAPAAREKRPGER